MSWIMFSSTILLIEIFRLKLKKDVLMGYSIMNMHSIHSETPAWSNMKVPRDFIDLKKSIKITPFMTLT